MGRTKFLLILDTILFVSVVVLLQPRIAGLAVHEWLGLALVPLIVIHVLYGWRWIAGTVVRLGETGAWRLRLNVLLNMLVFIAFVVTTFSGTMTSFIALPALGIGPGNFQGWRILHNECKDFLWILVAMHIAMNWGWIVEAIRRHVLARPPVRGDAAIGAVVAGPTD